MPAYKLTCKCGFKAIITANHKVNYFVCQKCGKLIHKDGIEFKKS